MPYVNPKHPELGEHHRVQIEHLPMPIVKHRLKNIGWYRVMSADGSVLIERTVSPEYATARLLASRGLTGRMVTYRGEMPCLVMHDLVDSARRSERRRDEEELQDEQSSDD